MKEKNLEQRMREAIEGIPTPGQMRNYLNNIHEQLNMSKYDCDKKYNDYIRWYGDLLCKAYIAGNGDLYRPPDPDKP